MRIHMTVIICAIFLSSPMAWAADADLSPAQRLGKEIFFDASLSEPVGQACASCHSPGAGFTSPDSARNAHEAVVAGALAGRAGNRTPPSVAYATFSPPFHWKGTDKTYVGGQFRDGRAANLVEQAKGPFLNPLEMNNADGAAVCRKVAQAPYAGSFAIAFDAPLDCATNGYERIAQALTAYETSREVNAFSSKFDAVLAGRAQFTAAEKRGLKLYRGKAKCEQCHPSVAGRHGEPPLFTDFSYDNIGAPKNPANPFYTQAQTINPAGSAYVDPGLGAIVKKSSQIGKFKVPTLRNIAAGGEGFVRAYMHNGSLKSLKDVMAFYNRRDMEQDRWVPEEPRNVNRDELGHLGLTGSEEDDVIAFLGTLTDGWSVRP